jgi:hypothetical protein
LQLYRTLLYHFCCEILGLNLHGVPDVLISSILLFCCLLIPQVHKGDALQGLQSNAVQFEHGKEPWRRIAAAAAAAGTSGSSSAYCSDTAEAAAVAAAAALGDQLLFVADQLFADSDAALANAIKTAHNEFWREYRLVSKARLHADWTACGGGCGCRPAAGAACSPGALLRRLYAK